MPEDDKDFSDYLTHTRGAMNVYSLMCGFLFSTITLLVANFATFDPFMIQVVLFILMAIFDLFLYNIMDQMVLGIYFVRRVPPFTKPYRYRNLRLLLAFILFGAAPSLLFLLRNLNVLAMATAALWVLMIIYSYYRLMRPLTSFRTTNESHEVVSG